MSSKRINHGVIVKVFDDRVRHIVLGHILFYMENNYVVLWFPVMKSEPPIMKKFSLMDLI